jgi:hypothetical protein
MDASCIPPFERQFFEGREDFTRIGAGAVGGKASGLWLIREKILSRLDRAAHPGFEVNVPRLCVICTDVFEAFLSHNDLWPLIRENPPDEDLARAFQRAELPPGLAGDLRALISKVHTPLAVRSSSLLEDALEHPFAGVYCTKMIPNNQFDIDIRARKLGEAVKLVWASTFFSEARSIMQAARVEWERERMAVILQEIVGEKRSERFYPTISGVGRSFNAYPTGHAVPEDGVVSLALGLGKTIVDGGRCYSYCPAYPRAPLPYKSLGDLMDATQNRFFAVHMGPLSNYDPLQETEYLREHSLDTAESDEALRFLASSYDSDSDRLYPGLFGSGPRVVNFSPVLTTNQVPLNDLIRDLLRLSREALAADVEIEFALNLDPKQGLPARLGFLQVRPMAASTEEVAVDAEELAHPAAVVASTKVLGNGTRHDIQDIVYVKPQSFDPARTVEVATEIGRLNQALLDEKRPYLLIGFGRFGTADPWLGIPTAWGQLSGAAAIVEATLHNMRPELSQGSHFFHNLVGFGVYYLAVEPESGGRVDFDWLDSQPAATETAFLRHLRLPRPLELRVDRRRGRGVIRHD